MALGERVEETKGKKRGRYEWRSIKKNNEEEKGNKREKKREHSSKKNKDLKQNTTHTQSNNGETTKE